MPARRGIFSRRRPEGVRRQVFPGLGEHGRLGRGHRRPADEAAPFWRRARRTPQRAGRAWSPRLGDGEPADAAQRGYPGLRYDFRRLAR